MNRAAKLERLMSAMGRHSRELIPTAPSIHPLAGLLTHIRGFPRRDTFWSDLTDIRSECDRLVRLEEVLGVAHLLQSERGSNLWFAAHVADLCDSLLGRRTSEGPPLSQADLEDCIVLGSLLAQWESIANYKDDITTGRPQRNRLAGLRSMKNDAAKRRVKERRQLITALLAERINKGEAVPKGGALESFLLRKLKEHGFTVTGRTVRNDLSALRDR